MCRPASMILAKERVYWSKFSDSHEDIRDEFKVREMVANNIVSVNVEISPPKQDYSIPLEKWVYRVDQDLLPKWYNAGECEERTRKALKDWHRAKVFLSGDHKVDKGQFYAYGSSSVKAYGSSLVKAYDSSSVVAYDSSSVKANDSSSVVAHDSSSVAAYNSSSVEANGSSSVVAYDSSLVRTYDSSSVIANGSSSVVAHDSSSVIAHNSSSVMACDSSSVVACNSSSVVAYNSSSVVAYDLSSVRGCEDSATVRLYGEHSKFDGKLTSPYAVVIDCRGDVAVPMVKTEKTK